ncbi:unnamed protein product [Camellia sinensis]
MGSGKRFAVLLCAEDSDYVKKKYGGYFGVFLRMLAEEGEAWDVFRVSSGEFPGDGEIGGYDGFVITGSCSDAHSNDLWICKLLNLLKKLDSMKKKVLGVCFGHQGLRLEEILKVLKTSHLNSFCLQSHSLFFPCMVFHELFEINQSNEMRILSRALGGKTGRSITGWDIGVRTVHLSQSSKLFASLKMPKLLSIIECHQDEVRELPPKAEVIAWSNKTGIEMFRYGDHMMGIQGHPEYTKDILLHLTDRLLNCNLILGSFADEVRANVEASEPDMEAWKKLCISFLKGGL